jgi:hypothetical protein
VNAWSALDVEVVQGAVPGRWRARTTSIYLQGIDPEEIITAVRARRAPI